MCAGPSSPLQIEINGNFTHVGQWLPVSPIAQCQSEHYDPHWENHTTCKMDRDTWTRKPGWVRDKPTLPTPASHPAATYFIYR